MSVQSAHNSTASSVGSLAATFGVAVSNNGLVRGFVSWDSSDLTFLTTVTDDKGNSYTIVDKIADAAQGRAAGSFYKEGITNGPTVITATLDAVNFKTAAMTLCVAEESGIATASAIDGHAGQQQTNPGTGTDAISSGNATTTANGDLVCSCVVSGTVTGVVHGTSFTDRESDTAVTTKIKCEDLVKSASGTIPGTWTDAANGASDSYITLVIAFKAAVTTAANVASSRVFRGGRGPGAGPAMRRMAPQQFPTPGPTDAIIPGPQIQTLRARGLGIGPRLRRMFPQQYPGVSTLTMLAPTEGTITIAGVASSITLTLAAVAGAIIIAGNAPSITTSLQVSEGAIVISGSAPSTTTALAATEGTVVIGGAAPSLSSALVVTDGAVIIGGNSPSIGAATFSPTEGAITIDGNAPSISLTIPAAAPATAPGGAYAGVRGAKLEWREWETLKKKRNEVERKAPQVARIIEEIAEQNFDLAPALKALSQQLDEESLRQAKIYRELMKLEIERNRFIAQLSEDDDEEAITLLLNG